MTRRSIWLSPALAIGVLLALDADQPVRAATWVVNSAADTDDGACDGAPDCTLREAINAANAAPDRDVIAFAIAGDGPHTIKPQAALPTIVEAVGIGGLSQPGSQPATASAPAVLMIEIDGSQAGSGVVGLRVRGGGSYIGGLAINRFASHGIVLERGGENVVAGNHIGTNAAGTSGLGNLGVGVSIAESSPGNRIGGPHPSERNVISGNQSGVSINAANDLEGEPPTTDNVVLGNWIGLDATGAVDVGNGGGAGVNVVGGAHRTLIGGGASGAGNALSGNGNGVQIDRSDYVRVEGNRIGTNAAGTAPPLAVPGSGDRFTGVQQAGVRIDRSLKATVGGSTPASGNLISGNLNGIVTGGTAPVPRQIAVAGNRIGSDVAGLAAIGNTGGGLSLQSIDGALVAGNLIVASRLEAIAIGPPGGVAVHGNQVGVGLGGAPMGNGILAGRTGVHVTPGSAGNAIGGEGPGEGNTIAHSGRPGVRVASGAGSGNRIVGNRIHDSGYNADGSPQPAHPGIDLGADNRTPNDPLDADMGPNDLQNYPSITAATAFATSTTVDGTLHSTAGGAFTVHVYGNPACDPNGHGEGRDYLGRAEGITDAAGNATWRAVVPVHVPPGTVLVATATNGAGGTSEFGPCFAGVVLGGP